MSADLAAPHSKPHFVVPPGACDCHMHIFGPAERYPAAAARTYTPRLASLADYSKMAATIGLERVVFVQPSAYGTDNRCLLDAMKRVGPSARGVIGLDGTVSEAALHDMDRAGVRGVRLNLASRGFRDAQQIAAMIHATADRIGPLGWHIQLFTELTVIQALADTLKHAPVPVVFDHMALADGRLGNTQAGLAALLGLVSAGHCWAKLSGCYRVSRNEPDFPDAGQIVRGSVSLGNRLAPYRLPRPRAGLRSAGDRVSSAGRWPSHRFAGRLGERQRVSKKGLGDKSRPSLWRW
jgi:predicted TIM-barrel fold metal-dependent hydrolase